MKAKMQVVLILLAVVLLNITFAIASTPGKFKDSDTINTLFWKTSNPLLILGDTLQLDSFRI